MHRNVSEIDIKCANGSALLQNGQTRVVMLFLWSKRCLPRFLAQEGVFGRYVVRPQTDLGYSSKGCQVRMQCPA